MNEMVSIIIPVYNREKYIEECVNSILEQSYPYFEIMIVDDGSTDKSVEICHRLVESDSRIRFFTVEHVGVSAARNKAMDEAKGEYLFFVDSDDVIHPLVLESLVAAMQEHKVSISAVRGLDVLDSEWSERVLGNILSRPSLGKATYHTNSSIIEKFFTQNRILGRMGGVMIDRAYVGQTRFRSDLRLGEDVRFVYENLIKGSGVAIIEEVGYFWRYHDDKSSLDSTYAGFLARNRCYELLWQSEEALGRMEHVRYEKAKALQNYISTQCWNQLYGQNGKQMRTFMKQHRKELLQAMDGKLKFRYYMAVYIPWLYFPCHKRMLKRKNKQKGKT